MRNGKSVLIMSYDALFSPIKLRGLELKNRVVLPGMNTKMVKNKHDVADDLAIYHGVRAAGGCALNIVEPACVCPETITIIPAMKNMVSQLTPVLVAA